jgi:hypothetical protein
MSELMDDFKEIIAELKKWDGQDVATIIHLFDRYEDIEDELYEEEGLEPQDEWEEALREIQLKGIGGEWPDGLAGHMDWAVVDVNGRYIVRDKTDRAQPYFMIGEFLPDENDEEEPEVD